jgi:secreted Zn-dependent insulinase-like peptidase
VLGVAVVVVHKRIHPTTGRTFPNTHLLRNKHINKHMTPRDAAQAAPSTEEMAQIKVGPDLNGSRTALDHKVYRQIVLPNGLRCVLIQDTLAMNQEGGAMDDNDFESDSDLESDSEKDEDNQEDTPDAPDDKDDGDDGGLRDAAASLLVGTGSAMDPRGCEGLAHAMEHFLHMGSEKYPGENDYEAYVANHGGSDNAFTEWEYTIYSVSVQQDYLFGALDRLAQHFVAPLLREESIARELKSVESEFQLNKSSDDCRRQQLLCATANPAHPFSRFAWGNLRSLQEIPALLGIDPLAEMRQFFDRYYYAANMRLVVMGAYTLDSMQAKVYNIFRDVPALPRLEAPFALPVVPSSLGSWDSPYTSPLATAGPLFTKERSLQKIFYILPIKERHNLIITWELPCMFAHWDSKPTDYLGHLMGHEAEGSLLSYLRQRGWATGCSAGLGEEGIEFASSHALYSMSFSLSETGLVHWREVVTATYAYIGMLRWYSAEQGWPEWIFNELKQLAEVSHQYSDEESPDDLVENLVQEMLPCYPVPPERLLDASVLLFRFDPDQISTILNDSLTPENARIDLMSSSFGKYDDFDVKVPEDATDTIIREVTVLPSSDSFDAKSAPAPQIEPMFGSLFWCQDVSEVLLQEWKATAMPQPPSIPVALPPQNPFVPTRYDLKDLPVSDSRHPLVNSSLKVCTTVGKKKQWFQATVMRYNRSDNSILLSYEDEEEQWHKLDQPIADFSREKLQPGFEASLDKRKNKFRLLVLASIGSGMIRSFGDEDDVDGAEGFPPIPPAAPRSRLPKEIASSNLLRMWHLQDRNFHRPIADFRIQVICEKANSTPLVRAVAELLAELVCDICTEKSYLASVCDIGSSVSAVCDGFSLGFHGFDDKLLDLVQYILPIFLSFVSTENSLPDGIPESRFDASLEVLRRKYKNQGMSSSNFCKDLRLQALRVQYWSSFEKLKALEAIDIPTFVQTASSLLSSLGVEVLFHGNVTEADAKQAKGMVESILLKAGISAGIPRKKYPPQTMLKLPQVKTPSLLVVPSKEHHDPNTAVEVYFQVGKDKLEDRVMVDLLMNMMDEPFFDHLRTKDQYGYEVECDTRWSYGITGMVFRVVSNVKSAESIVARVDQFLLDFRKTIVEMSKEDYMEHVVALASSKLEMFNAMAEEYVLLSFLSSLCPPGFSPMHVVTERIPIGVKSRMAHITGKLGEMKLCT